MIKLFYKPKWLKKFSAVWTTAYVTDTYKKL